VNLTLSDNTHSVENAESRIAPEAIALDQALLDRPQSAEIQLDLFGDYKSNVALYPRFQEYFRTYRRPTLAVWGKNDPANGSSKQNSITPRKDELNNRSGPRSKSRNEVLDSRRTTLSECLSWYFARTQAGENRRRASLVFEPHS
jgi:hypothetical protein